MTNTLYLSTRGQEKEIKASYAIVKGIASDGGLYVPAQIPKMDQTLEDMLTMSYQDVAYHVMKHFFSDFTECELKDCISKAYDSKFDTEVIAPVVQQKEYSFLELFHGPTIAFKDMALSILPYLLTTAAKKQKIEEEIVILAATSGDTGKAALAGFADVEGTKIIVFYPKGGVSKIQELQMVTQKGDNTCVVGIDGNFDDAQTGVKEMFQDEALKEELKKKGYVFSSANSINIGRLVPQVAYYFYGYLQMVKNGSVKLGDKINVAVPTGNFGNILAAYYAKEMGCPIGKLLCASNDNKVLYDFFSTGTYNRKREFMLTCSPSMDILVSSNLERLLFALAQGQGDTVKNHMESLSVNGEYTVDKDQMKGAKDFIGYFATEKETYKAIHDLHLQTGYIMDTHTAVGYVAAQKLEEDGEAGKAKTLIVSTASPYKFPGSVMGAIDERYSDYKEMDLLVELKSLSGVDIPGAVKGLDEEQVLHDILCGAKEMKACVKEILA